MFEKEIHSRNRIRTALLVITISLFILITTIFFISITYFQDIQSRISKLIVLTEVKDERNEGAIVNFLKAENYFNKYCMNLSDAQLVEYYHEMNRLKETVEAFSSSPEKTSLDSDKDLNIKMPSEHTLLKAKINTIISKTPISNPSTLEINTISQDSLLSLISEHYSLLYQIRQTLLELDDHKVWTQHSLLQKEHNELLIQSKKLTWHTILCLIFIFILIFVMIYYQFRNKYYETKLIQEQQYAAKLATEKSDILAEISHEIRTPINSLIGIIDLLRKRSSIYTQQEILFLDSAYANITSTSRTINDILNLSKIDSIDKIDYNNFDIGELANDILLLHKSQAELKQIKLELLIEQNTPTLIYSDELKIRQILTNLISNSIRYTNHGKISCRLKINKINNLAIKIQDTGTGIPSSIQPNIFKKYFTKEDEKKTNSGIGLGLYITSKLVNKLQGKISFTSKVDIGTTFSIEIPIPQAKFKDNLQPLYQKLSDFPKELSWLLIDDNILNILYLKQYFQTFDHVQTATQGMEALEILRDFTPDLIITDINMPIMSGDELLSYIRDMPALQKTKVIATSSDYEQIRELEIKRNVFFDNIIIKPFNEKDLVKIIEQTIFPSKQ